MTLLPAESRGATLLLLLRWLLPLWFEANGWNTASAEGMASTTGALETPILGVVWAEGGWKNCPGGFVVGFALSKWE